MANAIKKSKNYTRFTIFGIVVYIFLVIFCISLLLPITWGFLTSLKSFDDFMLNPLFFPKKLMFKNYLTILEEFYVPVHVSNGTLEVGIGIMIFYSLIYAVITPLIGLAANVCVAYVTARFNYAFSKIIYGFVIITMIFPIIGNLPSQLSLSMALGLYDNFLGVFVRSAGFGGTTYLVLYASFSFVPKSFSEAAKMDGASNFRIFLTIELPNIMGILGTYYLLSFIGCWNDYSISVVWLPSFPMLAYGLFRISFNSVGALAIVPMRLAGCMTVFIPILIIFIIFQKRLLVNLSMGGVKE